MARIHVIDLYVAHKMVLIQLPYPACIRSLPTVDAARYIGLPSEPFDEVQSVIYLHQKILLHSPFS